MDVQKKFEESLELAKEDHPLKSLEEQIAIAVEWTLNDVTNLVTRLADQRKWGHIEAVNQHIEATSGRFG